MDTYTSLKKQLYMMKLILGYYDSCRDALEKGADIETLAALPERESVGRFKYTPEEEIDMRFELVQQKLNAQIAAATEKEDA